MVNKKEEVAVVGDFRLLALNKLGTAVILSAPLQLMCTYPSVQNVNGNYLYSLYIPIYTYFTS